MIPDLIEKLKPTLKEYFSRVRMFRPNARLYLISALSNGIAMGVYRVLFNFYVLSLGYNEALLGRLITTSQFTALILALPMGYLVDRWGRKNALVTRTLLLGFSIGAMALFPSLGIFYGMNGLFGIVRSISSVAMAPFLMENSGEEERTYLFSFSSGLRMGSIFVGNWVGGYLPTWLGNLQGLAPTSSEAYGSALLAMTFVTLLGLIPLFFLKPIVKKEGDLGPGFAPITYATRHPKLLGKLLFPSLLISIGAGLFMPFMNIFFRTVHNQTDQVIGTLFAWGSLAMGIGLLIAPPIADRLGKIQLVIITQGLSIPFMAMLGFSPLFSLSTAAYYVRLTLMNMSNPIYQTFVMEKVDQAVRSTVASLVSLTWSFGRAFSPTISGWLQVQYGFGPPFAIAITLYSIAIVLYWLFFIRLKKSRTLFPSDEASPASE